MIRIPIIKLLQEGRNSKLDIKFGKWFSFSMPITNTVKVKAEPLPEFDNFSHLI